MSNIVHLFAKCNPSTDELRKIENSSENFQMSLPFNAPHPLYLISAEIDVSYECFQYFIIEKNIAVFFDMRFSPRLDFFASNRAKALSQFKKLDVLYCDVFGRAGVESFGTAFNDRLEISKEIVAATEEKFKKSEPCFMAFDSQWLARDFHPILSQYFEVHEINTQYIKNIADEFTRIRM